MVKILVYCATNKVNNKKYIGQTIHTLDYRKKQHINNAINNIKGGCRVFWRAIRKYGVDNFEWEILCEVDTLEELGEKESYYIEKFNTTNSQKGYNLKGGSYNPFLSEETKKRIGEAQKGEKNHMYGKKGKYNHSSIPVYNLTDNIQYESATECAEMTGLTVSKICAVCRGDRATTGNKVFRYIIDGKIKQPYCKTKSKRIIDNKTGIIYNSGIECSKELNISKYIVYNETRKPNGRFTFL